MNFVNREGKKLITIRELFRTKKPLGGINGYYFFLDTNTQEGEVWTFLKSLSGQFPLNTSEEEIKEIVSACGWCRQLTKKEVKQSQEIQKRIKEDKNLQSIHFEGVPQASYCPFKAFFFGR